MAKFNPQKPPQGDPQGVPAGDYLLAMRSLMRKQSTKPPFADFIKCRIEVIYGPGKGRSFWTTLGIDTSNGGMMTRLAMYCEQVGLTESFDLDSDDELKAAFIGKPFKAKVSRKVQGQYTNNDVERYLNKEVTQADREIMDTWLAEEEERRAQRGDGDPGERGAQWDNAPIDDNGMPDGPGYGGYNGPGGIDDDIPF
jgi:hypothetical protein